MKTDEIPQSEATRQPIVCPYRSGSPGWNEKSQRNDVEGLVEEAKQLKRNATV